MEVCRAKRSRRDSIKRGPKKLRERKIVVMTTALPFNDFAERQMRIAERCTESRMSEADTIEKLVVPVFERIYDKPLWFERASRATKGKRKWDLEVFEKMPGEQASTNLLLALVECKSARTTLHTNDFNQKAIDIGNLKLSPGKTVKDYLEASVDAHGDDWLQVWLYAHHNDFTKRTSSTKTVLTNGVQWLVFKESFFRDDHGNPPSDIEIAPQDSQIYSNDYYALINFPRNKLNASSARALSEWQKCFYALGKELV